MNRRLKIFLLLIAAFICAYFALCDSEVLTPIDVNRNFYKEALNLEESGNYKEAYYAYKKVSPMYVAYEGVLYHQAKCASDIEDEKTAIKKLETLVSKYPNSKLAPSAHYKLGQAYLRNNENSQAERTFKKISKKYIDTEYQIAAYYYISSLERNNTKIANKNRKKYIQLSPSGRFSLECAQSLISTNAELSNNDKRNIALVYYYAERYSDAIQYFEQLPLKSNWYYLAKSYDKKGQKDLAKAVIKNGFQSDSAEFSLDELNEMTRLYAKLTSLSKYDTWKEIATFTKNAKNYPYVLYNIANAASENEKHNLYLQIAKDYNKSPIGAEVLWKMMWDSYKAQNYHLAIVMAKRHRQNYENEPTTPKIIFWCGKALEKEGKRRQAAEKYHELIENYNASYYAYRAQGRLNVLEHRRENGFDGANYKKIKKHNIKPPLDKNKISKEYGKALVEYIELKDFELISLYEINDKLFEIWLEYKKGNPSKACLLSRNFIELTYPHPKITHDIYKLAFPTNYTSEINTNAARNHIDANLIISLMREESYFNERAKSVSNARGLMQILPTTANHIASIKNIPYNGASSLFIPEENIKIGSAYLAYLKSLTPNMLYSVASYNAGPGAVQKWMGNHNDIDEFVENIPYPETQNYVKKVYRSYWCYKRLY